MIVLTDTHIAVMAMLGTLVNSYIAFFAKSFPAQGLLVHWILFLLRIRKVLLGHNTRVASGNEKIANAHATTYYHSG